MMRPPPNEAKPMTKTYMAEVRRSGRWWAIDVPEVKGVFTQARRLADVEAMARDAIGAVLDLDPASVRVSLRVIDARYEKAKREALAELEHGYNLGGGKLPSRDELYDL